jgi:CheY-like chemotaxis protein
MDGWQAFEDVARRMILLIEEDPARGQLLSEGLHHEGFHVQQVSEVSGALRHARTSKPELIIVHPGPTISVGRALARLRADPATAELPLIVIRRTGVCGTSGREYAWPAGPVEVNVPLEHVCVISTRILAAAGETR